MGKFRVYITPFDDAGVYQDEIEITNDVLSLGSITSQLDSNEYDIGIQKAPEVNIQLRNDHGKYSEPGSLYTVFGKRIQYVRCRISWHPREFPLSCGWFTAEPDGPCGEEVNLFQGFLSDITNKSDIDEQLQNLKALGCEHTLTAMIVPWSAISNGDLISTTLVRIIRQSPMTHAVTVNDADVVPANDLTIDDKTSLENQTSYEAIQKLMLATNSVLFIENYFAYVRSREENSGLAYSFYGPESENGIENIIDIKDYRSGVNRVINFFSWKDASNYASDSTSIATYGTRKKEIDLPIITNSTDINTLLNSLLAEFKNPKREMTLICPLSLDIIALQFLDQVSIDYPSILYTESEFGYYESGIYGTDRYPYENQVLIIESTARFKILGKTIDTSNEIVSLYLREV